MSQNHPARLRQQRQSTNPTLCRLTDWNATDLVLQAIDEDRPVSELLAEILADDEAATLAAERAQRWELATMALIVAGVIAIGYFTAIGLAASIVAWGWSA